MRRQLIISLVILLVVVVAGYAIIHYKKYNTDSQVEKKEEHKQPAQKVKALTLQPENIAISVSSQGFIKPAIETVLATQISGVVTYTNLIPGTFFKKGDILVKIDDRDVQVALHQAEALVAANEAELKKEQATANVQKKNWLRTGKALKDAPELLLREPYLEQAKANLDAAKAQLEKAQRDLNRSVIRAPYDGMVKTHAVNLGQYLMSSTSIATIFSVNTAQIRLPISQSDFSLLKLSVTDTENFSKVKITLNKQKKTWQAQLISIEGVIDSVTRMHYVIVEIKDPYALKTKKHSILEIGSFVQVTLKHGVLSNVFKIPKKVIYANGSVLLIDDKSSIRFKPLNIVLNTSKHVYVQEGFKTGNQICITPLSNPISGSKVTID